MVRLRSNTLLLFILLLSLNQILLADSFTYSTFTINGGSTSAFGINDVGQVTGYTQVNGISYGFIYQDGAAVIFSPPGSVQVSTLPSAINNFGIVAGTTTSSAGGSGFLYNQGEFTTLGYPGANYVFISGINDEGEVIGVYFDQSRGFKSIGFYQDASGTSHTFTGAFANSFVPTSIDNAGRIGGLLYGFGTSASAIYVDGTYNMLPAGYEIEALNNVGQAAVYIQPYTSGGVAVPGSFAILNSDGTEDRFSFPSDWVYSQIGGLNDEGQLAGSARTKSGSDVFSFIATPFSQDVTATATPEPTSFLLGSTGLVVLALVLRKRT